MIGSLCCGDQTLNAWTFLGPFLYKPSACPLSSADECCWSLKGWYRQNILCASERLSRSFFRVMTCSPTSEPVDGYQPFIACLSWKLPLLRITFPPKSTAHLQEALHHDTLVDMDKIFPPGLLVISGRPAQLQNLLCNELRPLLNPRYNFYPQANSSFLLRVCALINLYASLHSQSF